CASTLVFFLFKHTAPTAVYTLSLHDALPISMMILPAAVASPEARWGFSTSTPFFMARAATSISGTKISPALNLAPTESMAAIMRSEEHTSELQSRFDLVCRLLLEKKNRNQNE